MAGPIKKVKVTLLLLGGIAGAMMLLLWVLLFSNTSAYARQQANVHLLAPHAQFGGLPDRYEPNDTFVQAKLIAEASPVVSLTFYSTLSPSVGSPADVDWYAFNVNPNSVLNVNAAASGSIILHARAFITDENTGVGTFTDVVGSSSIAVTNTTATIQKYLVRVTNDSSTNAVYSLIYSSAGVAVPTVTSTPVGLGPDPYEPNDTIAEASVPTGTRGTASFIAVGARIDSLSFGPYVGRPIDTADWFQFYGRAGSIYQVTTLNVQPGVETVIAVYQPVADPNNPNLVLVSPLPGSSNPNNRYQAGQRGSQVTFQVPNNAEGLYWVRITNTDPSPRLPGQSYSFQVQEILLATATPGPTPTWTLPAPTSTPYPGTPDRFEYNGSFDQASLVAPNTKFDSLNFVPWQPPTQDTYDNDFYRLPVKQGIYYTCQTLDLAPGVDTNIIIYNQDRVGIGGNDDISAEERSKGNFASRFTWLASYTGNAFILVGEVNPPKANEAGAHTYSLRCDIGLPATPTPTATVQGVPAVTREPPTPEPPEATMTPYPTPRSAQNLPVRPIDGLGTTPTPEPTATLRVVSLNVQIFNDINKNGVLDPGEGISGVSVRVTDEQSGVPLAQNYTDADGRANISVISPGPVRVSVPLFGYTELINDAAATVRISVVRTVALPTSIP
jgi:hypothetical protein